MFTALSTNTRRNDLTRKQRLHRQKVRRRFRGLQCRIQREMVIQRERALICRLLAHRFAPGSPQRVILRALARNGMHRMHRLESVLHEFPGTNVLRTHRRWLCRWKCWYACNAPRNWAISRLCALLADDAKNTIETHDQWLAPIILIGFGLHGCPTRSVD